MRNKYYFSMLSIVLITLSMDLIVYFTSDIVTIYEKQYSGVELFIGWFGFNLFVFGVINLAGSAMIFRPIQKFLLESGDPKMISGQIANLPTISSIWVFSLGVIYSVFVLFTIKDYLNNLISIVYFIFIFLYGYSISTTFLVYFVVNDYTGRLKEKMYDEYEFIFPSGSGKIWHKLAIVFTVISFLPISTLIADNLIARYHEAEMSIINAEKMVFIDGVCCMILIFVAIYFVTKSFTRPMNLLVKSIKQVHKGNLTVKTPVVSDDETGILTHEFNSMVKGLREKAFIRDTLGKYITEDVANLILNQKMHLSGDLRLATIFVSDIANYTTISESQSPEDIVKMLNEYFTQVLNIIVRNNGIVNKFIGDSVFALFNVPVDDNDHAKNAIKSAIQIQHLVEKQVFSNDMKLSTRIGINTGMVVAGNIGSKERMEYTVIGDEVNIAARLEQLNKQYKSKIMIGPQTYELAKNNFDFESIGSIKVKGKSKTVDVYKVII